MSPRDMLNKAKRFERGWKSRLSKTLRRNKDVLLDLQKSQLLTGKDKNLTNLMPSYANDPFFKTSQGREKYIILKALKEAQHNQLRRYNIFGTKDNLTPNLIVTGSYHKGLRIKVNDEEIEIVGTWSRSKNIEGKYPTALGLSDTAFKYFWDRYARRDLLDYWNGT